LEVVMNVPLYVRHATAAVAVGLLAAIVAVVAPPAASAAAPAGIRTVQGESTYDSQFPKVADVWCPAGERLLGVGAAVSNPNGVRVYAVVVSESRVFVSGREDGTGTTENWLVRVTAKCVPQATATALELELVWAETPSDWAAAKTATVSCPPGKWVAGVGGGTSGSDSTRAVIDQIVPHPGGSSALVHATHDETPPLGPWSVRVQATCINTQPHIATLQGARNATRVFTHCPPSHPYAIAGGAAIATDANPPNQLWVAGGLGQMNITRYGAGGDLDTFQTVARMTPDATGFPTFPRPYLWGYAVCL
jgi:hypothetical protein